MCIRLCVCLCTCVCVCARVCAHARVCVCGLPLFIPCIQCTYYAIDCFHCIEKIERLEMLLYKVLKATEHCGESSINGDDVCSLQSTICPTEGDINCASIDLLHGTSDCQICVQGGWQANIPCKLQLRDKKNFVINDEVIGVEIHINEKGDASGTIKKDYVIKAHKHNCMLSQYSYTNISGTGRLRPEGEDNQLLFCQKAKDILEQHYCLKVRDKSKRDDTAEGVCYEKKGSCDLDGDMLSCTTKEYESGTVSDPVINTTCTQLKETIESLNCEITIASVNDKNIIINNGTHQWDVEKVRATVSCLDGKKCTALVSDLCMYKSRCNLGNGEGTPSGDEKSNDNGNGNDKVQGGNDKDQGGISSALLLIIIVILVVLLVSYCGYQNQWHHKVYV